MSRKYTARRKDEIKKREQKTSPKTKLEINNEIICMSCGKFSGWTNDDLIYVSGHRTLNCKSCKKPCIEIMCKTNGIETKTN